MRSNEVRRPIAKSKEWADALGKTAALRISDRQDASVSGTAAELLYVLHCLAESGDANPRF
jgi:hypothetical protein